MISLKSYINLRSESEPELRGLMIISGTCTSVLTLFGKPED